jgi:hypothetical protein
VADAVSAPVYRGGQPACPEVGLLGSGTADNATATATVTGVAGVSHYVTKIVATFSAAAAAKLLTWKDGATTKGAALITNYIDLPFWPPLKITAAADAVATLAASGTGGVTGTIYLYGFTAK